MATTASAVPTLTNPNGTNVVHRNTGLRREGSKEAGQPASTQVAHTLTACTRCRQRKTRCDPTLPRCGPCERTNSICEYFDSNKGHNVNRNYVVYLQHRVRELEGELERVESEEYSDDPEAMMRAATVRVHEATESKYLGPSSGIAITRVVMQLAKQFTDAKSIKDIVPDARAKQIRELFNQEQAKPTSKIYPVTSNVAAPELPNPGLVDLLVKLYKLKVQPLYPALHEPTLDKDVAAVQELGPQATCFQNFITRMVIAISLQKMDTQYAGLADSYYLAALHHLEPCVRHMDLRTLQCFALMAEYSLLTPTRTAIYYVVGLAVRLAQALGYNEEKTITRGRADGKVDHLEIDMRRRLFWCTLVMECGLAHSLGRPCILATGLEHLDVGWFETCGDQYITPDGIDPAAQRPTLKKWVAIHFFKMRLLQLEIRRKLYQRKRPEPKDDSDQWFLQMDAKLNAWRDATPNEDDGGIDRMWFVVRYYTMVVFLYRPSPQVPRPSANAALRCFDACQYNIYVQREQITNKNVDLTWVFTQSLFMAINTMLWSLSYVEVRRKHVLPDVEKHLNVAMEAIQLTSGRWPGVASAVQLYQNLISAILKIYEKDGDVPISAATPSDAASPAVPLPDALSTSITTSPATVASSTVATPPEAQPPFGHFHLQSRKSVEQPPPVPYQSGATPPPMAHMQQQTPLAAGPSMPTKVPETIPLHPQSFVGPSTQPFDNYKQFNQLPQFTPDMAIPGWNTAFTSPPYQHTSYASSSSAPLQQPFNGGYADNPIFDPNNQAYLFPAASDRSNNEQLMPQYWDLDQAMFNNGLDQSQQQELMQTLATDGMEDIQSMITSSVAALAPRQSS